MTRLKSFTSILFFFISVISSFAADGSGGGKGSPLTLESASVSDGETHVETNRQIRLVFSKNISNIAVKEKNLGCFSMTDSAGQMVPLETVLFDDQLEREKRNEVVLKPAGLKNGEQYVLKVSRELTAKNGDSPEQDLVIRFSTPGYKTNSGRFPVVLMIPIVLLFVSIAYFMNQKK